MINRIISLLFVFFIAISSVILFIIALLIWLCTLLFDRRLALLHQFTSFWAYLYIWTMPAWSVSIHERRRIKKGVTYVVVSNHQSQLDILVAFGLFFHFKWVSKAEIFRLPLIGWNMTLNRYIKIKRGDRESIRKMLSKGEKTIARGSSVFFFPEGTRSKNGLLKSFKPGAFILAKKMKVPILPIAINGSKNALPKHSLNFHGKHRIEIKVLDEIPYGDFKALEIDEIAEYVRGKIAAHVDEHAKSP